MQRFGSAWLFLCLSCAIGWSQLQLPDGGKLVGTTYSNDVLGFSLQVPTGWITRPAVAGGNQRLLFKLTPAQAENPIFIVYWNDLKNAFLIQSSKDALALFSNEITEHDFEVRQPIRPVTFAGKQFHRVDFQSKRKKNRAYQAAVAIIVERRLILFSVMGHSPEETDNTLQALETIRFAQR